MEEKVKELLQLLEEPKCNYDRCRILISEIGGCTELIKDNYNCLTTPLVETVENGHYDFALELINDGENLNLDTVTDWETPLLWDLQYLWTESEDEMWKESENKLRLIRELIKAGANPNPICGGEELFHYLAYEVYGGGSSGISKAHCCEMLHIVEKHAYAKTDLFWQRIKEQPIKCIMLHRWGFHKIDDDLCEADGAVFVFENGDRMELQYYRSSDEESDFYAVPFSTNIALDSNEYKCICPHNGYINFISRYDSLNDSQLHYLKLSIDDAALLIHADDNCLTLGIVGVNDEDCETRKRKKLF